MHSFLVTALDRVTGEECRFIVQSSCQHGMQAFAEALAAEGKLAVANPVVIDIDEYSARHIPLVNPAER